MHSLHIQGSLGPVTLLGFTVFGEIYEILRANSRSCKLLDIPDPLHIESLPSPKLGTLKFEPGLGLQLCFLHSSNHIFVHPRFTYETQEYIGQKTREAWSPASRLK